MTNTKLASFNKLNSSCVLDGTYKTNFIYDIDSIVYSNLNSPSKANIINNIDNIKFKGIENKVFNLNLIFIDTILPELLSFMLIYGYSQNCSSIKKLTLYLIDSNPLKLSESFKRIFYIHKIKIFLDHVVRGLSPNTIWEDNVDIYDNYPVIKYDNELLYYSDDINKFRTALLETAHIETSDIIEFQEANEKANFSLSLKININ